MGHNLRKTKTSKRVKRTNTNKRNNTQKQRRLRKQTFRKNRRANRGGNGTGKRTREEEMHEYEQTVMDAEKDENNMKKQKQNMEKNMYRQPLGEGLSEVDEVDQSSQLEITENQNRFNDDMHAEGEEGEEGGIWFGGKKKSHNKK